MTHYGNLIVDGIVGVGSEASGGYVFPTTIGVSADVMVVNPDNKIVFKNLTESPYNFITTATSDALEEQINYVNNSLQTQLVDVSGALQSQIDFEYNYSNYELSVVSGSLQSQITETNVLLSDISGSLQSQIVFVNDSLEYQLTVVSGSLQSQITETNVLLSDISGSLQSQITETNVLLSDISGSLQSQIDFEYNYSNYELSVVSGSLQSQIDLTNALVVDVSGSLYSQIVFVNDSLEYQLTSVSGSLENQILQTNINVSNISGDLVYLGQRSSIAKSITDYGADLTGTLDSVSSINAALAANSHILIPPGTFKINSNINVPASTNIIIEGIIIGVGRLIFSGDVSIQGSGTFRNGTNDENYSLEFQSGKVHLSGFNINPAISGVCGIGIAPTASMKSLVIKGLEIWNTGYAILRNQTNSLDFAIESVLITNNIIHDIYGDAIEFNICPLDRRVHITSNEIYNINGIYENSGIAIGVAGGGDYAFVQTYTSFAQDISISDNKIDGARQGIHLELTKKSVVSNNKISNISNSYGHSSLPITAIATYDCYKTTICKNTLIDNTDGIFVGFGVINATYTGSPRDNIVCDNILQDSGNIETNCSQYQLTRPIPIMIVKNNEVFNGKIIHKGLCHLTIDTNNIRNANITDYLFELEYKSVSEPFGAIYAQGDNACLTITDNNFVDDYGRTKVNITGTTGFLIGKTSGHKISGNNFSVPRDMTDNGPYTVNRTFYVTEAGWYTPPAGQEFVVGDVIVNTQDNTQLLVIAPGSWLADGSTFLIDSVSDATNGIIYAPWLIWGNYISQAVGQRIRLSYGAQEVIGWIGNITQGKGHANNDQTKIQLINAAGNPINILSLGMPYNDVDNMGDIDTDTYVDWKVISDSAGTQIHKLTGISVSDAAYDTKVAHGLPPGFIVRKVTIYKESSNVSTATYGLYTGPGATGVTIVTNAAATLSNTINFKDLTIATQKYFYYEDLYFRVGTAQGSGLTIGVIIEVEPLQRW